ncbi:MAG: hypothetical protein MAG715_00021 [Methanonatronarchaeales archaeon]|nr:hypothetical protein [Methanonatronarchaeales archaeon]
MIELLGTAHVSGRSVEKVERRIRETRPDVVAVELCPARLRRLREGSRDLDVSSLLRGNLAVNLLTWLLSYVQSRVGADLGVRPGEEMVRALEVSEELGIPVVLVDRDIRVTLNRLWTSTGLLEKLRTLLHLVAGALGFGERREVDIDELAEGRRVDELVEELRHLAPTMAEVLIDERDAYMASNLVAASERGTVLAVVGAGHVPGITAYTERPATIPPTEPLLATRTRRISFGKVLGAGITIGILGMLVAIFLGQPLEVVLDAMVYWFLINGAISGAAVLVVRGHPASVATAFGTAWLTSLTVFLAAGWFAGVSEAYFRKPGSKDLDAIMEAATLDELLSNDLFRVVLVAAAANVGSIAGTILGGVYLARVAGIDLPL